MTTEILAQEFSADVRSDAALGRDYHRRHLP
jgi:hypothetical protein